MRYSQWLAATTAIAATVTDADITAECPTCRERQTLAAAQFTDGDAESFYVCRHGCARLTTLRQQAGGVVVSNARRVAIRFPDRSN